MKEREPKRPNRLGRLSLLGGAAIVGALFSAHYYQDRPPASQRAEAVPICWLQPPYASWQIEPDLDFIPELADVMNVDQSQIRDASFSRVYCDGFLAKLGGEAVMPQKEGLCLVLETATRDDIALCPGPLGPDPNEI